MIRSFIMVSFDRELQRKFPLANGSLPHLSGCSLEAMTGRLVIEWDPDTSQLRITGLDGNPVTLECVKSFTISR